MIISVILINYSLFSILIANLLYTLLTISVGTILLADTTFNPRSNETLIIDFTVPSVVTVPGEGTVIGVIDCCSIVTIPKIIFKFV